MTPENKTDDYLKIQSETLIELIDGAFSLWFHKLVVPIKQKIAELDLAITNLIALSKDQSEQIKNLDKRLTDIEDAI